MADSDGELERDRLHTELMARWRDGGDGLVFEELYAQARGSVFEWLRWLMRGRSSHLDPLDLLQDTFVNVYRYRSSFRDAGPRSFRCWVRTIAGNVLRRALVRSPGRSRHEVNLGSLAEFHGDPVDPQRGPALRLVEGEEERDLRRTWSLFLSLYAAAYESLSERDRTALAWVEVEGLSYADVGERLRVSPSNMKMIMLRARQRLMRHLRAALGRGIAQVPHDAPAERLPMGVG